MPKVVVAEKEASIEVQAPAAADIAVQDSHGGVTKSSLLHWSIARLDGYF